ncbi:hypothetical protein JR338_12050 [Chloroflexota bacterium]|nr:hypothetical protein JR338_12050 [Chloroflexota bacterium]
MANKNQFSLNKIRTETVKQWSELFLSFVVLCTLLLFTYTLLFLRPYIGFFINSNNGQVTGVDEIVSGVIQEDDIILSINNVAPQDFNNSFEENPIIQTEIGENLHITLLRNGDELQVDMPKPAGSEHSFLARLTGDWIIPYPFFAAGLIAILFIRPRSKTRTLLYFFFFSFAIWISAGQISSIGYWSASKIMRVFIWLSVPIAINLHWLFPIPFKNWKKWVGVIIYILPVTLALLDILDFLPSGIYLLGFILSMGSSLTLLIIKFFKFKGLRSMMWSLLGSYIIAIIPIIFLAVMMFINKVPQNSNIAIIGLTAIPGFYFFTAYKTSLKQEFPRINVAMRLFISGIFLAFIFAFFMVIAPTVSINPTLRSIISFGSTFLIGLTGFGMLLIMPALANDQINLFQNQSYTLRFSANRAAAFINFLFFLSPLYVLALLSFPLLRGEPFTTILFSSIVAVVGTGLSVLFFKYFLAFFDRVILGIKLPPDNLIHQFTQKITLSLDHPSLVNLIKEEILPSLMIRESILLLFDGQPQPKTFLRTGINDEECQKLIQSTKLQTLKFLPSNNYLWDACPWVKLVLPLSLDDEFLGVWLFGWRDPNNIYDEGFKTILKTLANQTAITLLNIHQNELLETLYNVNMERQEAEKAELARDLHDVLLPSLGYLVELQSSNSDQKEFEKAVQQINDMVREIMSGLRPSSLDMGLDVAIEELADQPEAQIGGKIKIETNLYVPKPLNYDQNVELHLYRIIQQACHNAYEHAQAQSILITGRFTEDEFKLSITDDGIGLPFQGPPNINELLANHHFGLANIFERAKIINASVSIHSSPKQGTSLELRWTPDSTS